MLSLLSLIGLATASPHITFAKISNSETSLRPETQDDNSIRIKWPFCPSYPEERCSELWVDMDVNIDGYIQRRNASHESWFGIIQETKTDVEPLARALKNYFRNNGISDMSHQAGIIQGMIQAVHYAYDNCDSRDPEADCNEADETGWTEYPKYGLEFIVDQKGDCEDAAIISSSLFDGVGIEAWMVNWDRHGGGGGHASTALTLSQGDLGQVSIPSGSEYVVNPKTHVSLLSADSVGSLTGCPRGWRCGLLGTNTWTQQDLYVSHTWKTDDPSIDDVYGGAWTKEGGVYKKHKRDRRKDSRQKIKEELKKNQDEWDNNTRKRLSKLDVEPEKIEEIVKKANPYQQSADDGWVFIMAIFSFITALIGYGLYQQRQRRLQLVREIKAEDENALF